MHPYCMSIHAVASLIIVVEIVVEINFRRSCELQVSIGKCMFILLKACWQYQLPALWNILDAIEIDILIIDTINWEYVKSE